MFKRRGFFLVCLSVMMAMGAAWVANNWIQVRTTPTAGNTGDQVEIATAAITIPYGTKVDARHVKMVAMPASVAPANAFRKIEDIEGQVSKTEVLKGEILINQRFVTHDVGSTLSALVEAEKRAITVRVDDVIGVAGFLLPGNFVDVLASRVDRGSRRAVTETVLTNVKVLAVDQTVKTEENEPVIVRAVTLEVTPPQAEVLVKRKEEGTIQLTLRNPNDTKVAEIKPEPKKAPVRRAYRAPTDTTITVIKGTSVNKTKAKT